MNKINQNTSYRATHSWQYNLDRGKWNQRLVSTAENPATLGHRETVKIESHVYGDDTEDKHTLFYKEVVDDESRTGIVSAEDREELRELMPEEGEIPEGHELDPNAEPPFKQDPKISAQESVMDQRIRAGAD